MKKLLLQVVLAILPFTVFSQTYFSDDFNDGDISDWTLVDADGDGNNWFTSGGVIGSYSWNGSAYNPNNWIISQAIDLSSATGTTVLQWEATASPDTAWDSENYTVYVATSNAVTTLQASTTTFSENLNGINLDFQERTLDVSAFNGQTIYVAFRHYNSYDQWYMLIDNVVVRKYAPNDAKITSLSFDEAYALNTNVTVSGTVKNNGSNAITAFDLAWEANGGTANSYSFSGLNIAPGDTYDFSHPTTWTASPTGTNTLTVEATSVNNTTDPDTSNNTLSADIMVVNEVFDRNVVYEEGTGTWCGWCPRGHVGLKDMTHYYPENFIGIGVHNGDPMTVTEYDNAVGNYIGGYPSGIINRNAAEVDPGLSELEAAYLVEVARVPVGKIEFTSVTWDATSREISMDLGATFALDMASANYNVAAIVVENGVTGTSSGYNQANYYSGGTSNLIDYEGINWKNLPNPVTAANMVYEHVGRALVGGWDGVSGVVPASVTYNTVYSTTLTHTLPTSQDENEVEVVALLIDNATGQIVNAHKVNMMDPLSASSFVSGDFKVYPNPSNGIFNFEVNGNFDLAIFDVSGKIVYTGNGLANTTSVNLSNLNSGIYFAKIKTETTENTVKLVIK